MCCSAYEGLSYRDPAFYAAQVFSGLLGGGMSSRLFQEVREKRGLVLFDLLVGLGAAATRDCSRSMPRPDPRAGGTGQCRSPGACDDRPARSPDEREVQRAKAQLKTGLLMSLESSVSRAEQMARQLLAFGRLLPAEEIDRAGRAVTAETVRDTAAGM